MTQSACHGQSCFLGASEHRTCHGQMIDGNRRSDTRPGTRRIFVYFQATRYGALLWGPGTLTLAMFRMFLKDSFNTTEIGVPSSVKYHATWDAAQGWPTSDEDGAHGGSQERFARSPKQASARGATGERKQDISLRQAPSRTL